MCSSLPTVDNQSNLLYFLSGGNVSTLAIIRCFEKNSGKKFPQGERKIRRVLAMTAGELVSPRITPEDFSAELIKKIQEEKNPQKRNALIIKAIREVGNS